jgi:hypothetical protein
MSETSEKLEEIPAILERIIDSRFKYLHELRFENHRLARHILENEYNPEVEKIKKILENIA